jgi:hypothetical protein
MPSLLDKLFHATPVPPSEALEEESKNPYIIASQQREYDRRLTIDNDLRDLLAYDNKQLPTKRIPEVVAVYNWLLKYLKSPAYALGGLVPVMVVAYEFFSRRMRTPKSIKKYEKKTRTLLWRVVAMLQIKAPELGVHFAYGETQGRPIVGLRCTHDVQDGTLTEYRNLTEHRGWLRDETDSRVLFVQKTLAAASE